MSDNLGAEPPILRSPEPVEWKPHPPMGEYMEQQAALDLAESKRRADSLAVEISAAYRKGMERAAEIADAECAEATMDDPWDGGYASASEAIAAAIRAEITATTEGGTHE